MALSGACCLGGGEALAGWATAMSSGSCCRTKCEEEDRGLGGLSLAPLEPLAKQLVAPRPSPQEREARLGPRRCPRQPPRGGAPAQSHLWPLRAVRLGQRWKRASARICPYRWAHGGKERWAPAREGRGTCAELALRDAARAWACTQGPRASKSKQLGSSQLSLPRELRSHPYI